MPLFRWLFLLFSFLPTAALAQGGDARPADLAAIAPALQQAAAALGWSGSVQVNDYGDLAEHKVSNTPTRWIGVSVFKSPEAALSTARASAAATGATIGTHHGMRGVYSPQLSWVVYGRIVLAAQHYNTDASGMITPGGSAPGWLETLITAAQGTGLIAGPALATRERSAPKKDPSLPNYDINTAMGSKAFGGGAPMPQQMRHVITVYMPQTPLFHRARKTLFTISNKEPPFRHAKIWGKAEWYFGTTMDYGPAAGVVIKAVHWLNGKPQRHVQVKTDAYGEFRLDLLVNPRAGQAERKFSAFPIMKVKRGKLPPGVKWVVPPGDKIVLPGSGAVQLPKGDWKKTVFNALSMYNALKKDYADQKLGGKGTPNFDQWKKNHEAGRESINALAYIIDIASGKATGHSSALDNAFKAYKNLTGKQLPFEKQKLTKQEAAAMKQASRDFWAWIKRNKEHAEN